MLVPAGPAPPALEPDGRLPLLSHLASYGLTVIASTSPTTGSGSQIDAAARDLLAQDGRPGSVFYRRLAAK